MKKNISKMSTLEFETRKSDLIKLLNNGNPSRTWQWQADGISCVDIVKIDKRNSEFLRDWKITWHEINNAQTIAWHKDVPAVQFINEMVCKHAEKHWTIGA